MDKLEELLRSVKVIKHEGAPKLNAVKTPKEPKQKVDGVEPHVVNAAKEAAQTLPGNSDETQHDLLSQLQHINRESGAVPLEELFVGMKIDRSKPGSRKSKTAAGAGGYVSGASGAGQMSAQVEEAAEQVLTGRQPFDSQDQTGSGVGPKGQRRGGPRSGRDRSQNGDRPTHTDTVQKARLFEGPGLGIFTASAAASATAPTQQPPPSTVWDTLEARELRLSAAGPPNNAIEELIVWTQQGKLWKFPIDNETGMEHEASVGFDEHVFLDHLIRDDEAFPEGPVRHFMELVCVGLSKNPYVSVERKHRCIEWYREYFTQNQQLIKAALG